jgi:alanine racemase
MVDTGINRLGVSVDDIAAGLLDGLQIETLMSHLACADEDSPMNAEQRDRFAALVGRTTAKRMSLANSGGVALGERYVFDLTRPGLALYGGIPRPELDDLIRQVVRPEAQILQRRLVPRGGSVGYNAQWYAPVDTEVGIVNLGYADGYWRNFSNIGTASSVAGDDLPVLGRVSMDLVAIALARDEIEGDWVSFDYRLPAAAAASGMSQYELLTGLGGRFMRMWE